MAFRIIEERERTVLRLAGTLAGESVDLLEKACAGAKAPVVLDLRDLRNVDDEGLETLSRLRQSGATLVNVSTSIEMRLESIPG